MRRFPPRHELGAIFGALLWMLAGHRISLTDGSDGTVWVVAASATFGLVIGIGAWAGERWVERARRRTPAG